MADLTNYVGRFAPSPTGPLHFGSLVVALGSYLDAKYHQGSWLVRMEDIDTPRTAPGAAGHILRTLDSFGLHWDREIVYQSRRTAIYDEAFDKLKSLGKVYQCACTRKEIADSALHGIDGQIYPGTCRKGVPHPREGRAWRVLTHNLPVSFTDTLHDTISQQVENEIGDFVIKRADDRYAYQLAVIVDDALQGITHVVRGADLLHSTPRQILLQSLLEYPLPVYMHLPVATNAQGEKLSKQTLAKPVDINNPVKQLVDALIFLRQNPPLSLYDSDVNAILSWAIVHWDIKQLRGVKSIIHNDA